MKGKAQDYNGIYSDMVEVLGEEMTHKIYQYYRGQQVSFPMRLYSKTYTEKYLKQHYNAINVQNYFQLISSYKIPVKKEKTLT